MKIQLSRSPSTQIYQCSFLGTAAANRCPVTTPGWPGGHGFCFWLAFLLPWNSYEEFMKKGIHSTIKDFSMCACLCSKYVNVRKNPAKYVMYSNRVPTPLHFVVDPLVLRTALEGNVNSWRRKHSIKINWTSLFQQAVFFFYFIVIWTAESLAIVIASEVCTLYVCMYVNSSSLVFLL